MKSLINKFEFFFSEDQGRYIIEVSKKNLKKIENILKENSVHFDNLGEVQKDNYINIDSEKISVDELSKHNKNWLNGVHGAIMAMNVKELEALIKEAFPDATVEIQDLAGDENHYSATVISSQFVGKSKIEQHKMVYSSLKGKMGNQLHALALKTKEKNGSTN